MIDKKYMNEDKKSLNDYRISRLYTPLKLFISYILITLCLSVFGPWKYVNYNKVYVVLYILIFIIAITLTYLYFVKVNKGITVVYSRGYKMRLSINSLWITKKSIILGLILFSSMLIIKVSEMGFPGFHNIFLLMAKAYTSKVLVGNTLNMSSWLFGYFSFFYVASIVLGTYYYKKLPIRFRIMYFVIIALSLIYNIVYVGNQKTIGDLLILISSVQFAKYVQSGKRIKLKVIITFLIGMVSSLFMFSYIIQSRMSLWNVQYFSVGGRAFLDVNHWILSPLSDNLKLGVGTFLYYLSSGYYGLSMSLELPFVWSYGYGSSFDMKYLLNKIIPLTENTIASYPVRMEAETGWAAYSNWHTIFPWLASDFTFWGAIIFLCIFIAIYAVSWNRVLRKGHWINILMFAHINIMLLYVPANNQLFQTRASLLVTVIITLIWIFNYNSGGKEV